MLESASTPTLAPHQAAPTTASNEDRFTLNGDGEPAYRIADLEGLEPFLISVVGSTDVWLFLASNGGLTAGRRDPDHAIFPYYTEDKVMDGRGVTGGVTSSAAPGDRTGRPSRGSPAASAATTWESGAAGPPRACSATSRLLTFSANPPLTIPVPTNF